MEQLKEKRFLTKSETADYLNIDIITLERFIKDGFLPVIKFGVRTYRIDINDIEKCIENQKRQNNFTTL